MTKNVLVMEKFHFYDQNDRLVMVDQMWRSFRDQISMYRDQTIWSLMLSTILVFTAIDIFLTLYIIKMRDDHVLAIMD
jgi:hypothetical protein